MGEVIPLTLWTYLVVWAYRPQASSRALCHCIGRCRDARSITTLLLLGAAARNSKVTNGRHLCLAATSMRSLWCLCSSCELCGSLCSFCSLLLCLGCGFRQELLEVFQKILCVVEKSCDLTVDVLDRLGLSLIRLEDFEELFVDLGSVLESVLRRSKLATFHFSSHKTLTLILLT